MQKDLKYAASSSNQRLAAIKSYAKYSVGCDPSLAQTYISIASVPMSTVPKIQREVLEEDDIAILLDNPPPTRKGLRDTLIMSILFDTAIRLDELVQLKTGDIYDHNSCTYLLIHGKGNKERKVSLDEKTEQLLRCYMREYHAGSPVPETPLIYTKYKGNFKHMTHRNIQKILKKYSGGLKCESLHPHLLRRSRSTDLYRNGTPIEIVSQFIGHSSVETTKAHYAFPSMEQIRKAMESGKKSELKEKPLWEGHEDELSKLCGLR
jgi:site-specific recombinase XerD